MKKGKKVYHYGAYLNYPPLITINPLNLWYGLLMDSVIKDKKDKDKK